MSAYESVSGLGVALADGVLRLVLDKPEKRNALDDEMMAALIEAIDAAGRDEDVRVIVLTGTGEHFCSGFDIVSRNAGGGPRPRVGSIQRRLPSQAHRLVPLVLDVQTPVVCAVRGWAAGIGLNLALAADFTVAATDAVFWEPFLDRGFSPDSGSTWLLPRLVGLARARRMLLLGEKVSATDAADWGLIHQAVSPPDLDDAAEGLLDRLACGPTVAIGLTKHALSFAQHATLSQSMMQELFNLELSCRTGDFKEGLEAFRQRRPPKFHGR